MATKHQNDNISAKRGRVQFSVRHLLLAIVSLSVLLALATQFKHVGFVIFCFLAAAVTGWRLKKWRLMSAGLTALCVFVITYVACWTQVGQASFMHREPYETTHYIFLSLDEALSQYAQQTGAFPTSLGDMAHTGSYALYFDESGELLDGWGHPLDYRKTVDGFEAASLGRDGLAGGVGLDADVFLGDDFPDRARQLPLKQFLFETRGSGAVFWMAALASLAAGSIWYGTQQESQLRLRPTIFGVLLMTIPAVLVAVFLAVFHVIASQSGH